MEAQQPKTIEEITDAHDLFQAVLDHPCIDIQHGRKELEMLKQTLCWILGHGDPAGIDVTIDALIQTLEQANSAQGEIMESLSEERVTVQ